MFKVCPDGWAGRFVGWLVGWLADTDRTYKLHDESVSQSLGQSVS